MTKYKNQDLYNLMAPEILGTEEQLALMVSLRQLLSEFIETNNTDDAHQIALAGFLLRYSVGFYKGVISVDEIQDLFDYVIDKIDDIPPHYPKNRIQH